jgi:hypothetical protein
MLDLLLPFRPSAKTEIGSTKLNSVSELYLSLFSGWVKKDVPEGTHVLRCQNFHLRLWCSLVESWEFKRSHLQASESHVCVMSFCLG